MSAAPPHPARARESARDDPVGLPARGEYPALRESASSGARREALRDGRDRPSSGRGEPGAGELDPPVSVPAASREMDLFDADLAGEPRGAALPGEGIPRRVPVERRAGDGPRDRARREGEEGLGIAAVRSGGLPEVGAGSLGSDARRRREASVESILDEARRRAEAIAEWERTGF